MKVFAALCLFFVCVYSAPTFNAELDAHWTLFKTQFRKKYSIVEEMTRRLAWESNVAIIRKHNLEHDLGLHSYTLGLNNYADLTNEEFNKVMNGLRTDLRNQTKAANRRTYVAPANVRLPDAVDWRKKGYVTEVKDQGQCGSCWAFSSTGSLEGQNFATTGQLVSLSEQNLVDCSGFVGNMGCGGGWPYLAFWYIQLVEGIDTETTYPYVGVDQTCSFNPDNIGATDTGYIDIAQKDENALQSAIATVGPISVAIDASHSSFQLYRSGIYDDASCTEAGIDHAVLAVGYDSLNGQDYYIVKNSWGTSWGIQGYIYMSRNKNNQCGIATLACYPTV